MHGRWNMLIIYVAFVLVYHENMWSLFSFPLYWTVFDDNFCINSYSGSSAQSIHVADLRMLTASHVSDPAANY